MKNSQNLNVLVESPNVKYTERAIEAVYEYARNTVVRENDRYVCKPTSSVLNIRTQRKVSKVGVMLIGWGGNNGSTVTGAILANKHNLCWQSKDGLKKPNW
ncbi:inositol-3-phosphate synthase-like [Diaphorina citri]|uniref:Inositol-3-phosphate synthase-like n=1 Tax=Diaphorina citri TaxID=121845 RepID=A0A1S3D1L9_DIACI|nr:inositol-3-phosphate synthase-like [Diaphorina citri]